MTELKLRQSYSANDSGTIYPVPVDSVSENGVTGVLRVAFTEPTHAYVGTEGHVNDDYTVLTYRGNEFLYSVHLFLNDGEWGLTDISRPRATRRDNWSDATEAQTRALTKTVLKVVNTYANTPEFVTARHAGTEKYARFDLESAERKLEEAQEQLKAARAAYRKAKVVHDAAVVALNDPEAATRNPFKTRGPQN